MGSFCPTLLNSPILLKVKLPKPFFVRPTPPINELDLPVKEFYKTSDVSKALKISPETFRKRILADHYPDKFRRKGAIRIFSSEEIKQLIELTEELKKRGIIHS